MGVLPLGEWSVISIVGKDVKVGEALGLAAEGLIDRVNTLDVIGLYVKSGPEVVVALTDEGVGRDDETIPLEVVAVTFSSPLSSNTGSSKSSSPLVSPTPRALFMNSGTGNPASLAAKS